MKKKKLKKKKTRNKKIRNKRNRKAAMWPTKRARGMWNVARYRMTRVSPCHRNIIYFIIC